MARPSNYPPELRARAVRMVAELTPGYPSQYAAITAVTKKLGIGAAETLRTAAEIGRIRSRHRLILSDSQTPAVPRHARPLNQVKIMSV
jgi:transposase